MVLAVAFIFGAVIGSFLNVCIYRIPAGKSVVSPPSSCPRCGHVIRWYQNVPIISWVLLGGKCSSCKNAIAMRYPLVEALNGVLYAVTIYYFSTSWAAMAYLLFLSLLVIVVFIDIDHQIIPNVITFPGVLLGFACSFFIPWLPWHESALGILFGALLLGVVAFGYKLFTGKEGMGMGDLKLLAMIGAFLGWKAVLPVVFVASLAGTFIGVPLMLVKGADGKLALPFGPFLSLAAVVYLFWWNPIFSWYQSFFY